MVWCSSDDEDDATNGMEPGAELEPDVKVEVEAKAGAGAEIGVAAGTDIGVAAEDEGAGEAGDAGAPASIAGLDVSGSGEGARFKCTRPENMLDTRKRSGETDTFAR